METDEVQPRYLEHDIVEQNHEQCGNGMIVWNVYGKAYWAQAYALDTLAEDAYPDGVEIPDIDDNRFVTELCEHIDGMFSPDGDRWDTFASRVGADVGDGMKMQEELVFTRPCYESYKMDIPLPVARQGQTVMYAYLAAHGWDNQEIATAFDVEPVTARVNLSKYKSTG